MQEKIKFKHLLLLALILGLTAAVLWPVLRVPFLSMDDDMAIADNQAIRSFTLENIKKIFHEAPNNIYIPLTSLSFMLDYRLFGLSSAGFHFDNLLLHLLIVALVFRLAVQCGLSPAAALLASLIFGIHPMHVESVAWAIERKDLLYTLFYLLGLLCYIRYAQSRIARTGRGTGFYLLTCLLAVLSMLSKPMAASFPLVLFLFDWFLRRPYRQGLWQEKIPFFLFIIPLAAVTLQLNTTSYAFHPGKAALLWIWTFIFYLKKFLLPFSFSIFYSMPRPVDMVNPAFMTSIILFILLGLGLARFRKNRLFLFAVGYYLCSIFFVLRFHDDKILTMPVVDRYMYLPSLGLCLWLGAAADHLYQSLRQKAPEMRGVFFAGLFLLTVCLGWKTYHYARLWDDEIKLLTHAIKHSPEAFYAYRNRATLYKDSNRPLLALQDYSQAIAVRPDMALGYFYRGSLYEKMNDSDAALADYTRAIELDPEYADPYNNRALIYGKQKAYTQALDDMNTFIRLLPHPPEAYFNRGLMYYRTQQYDEALKDFDHLLQKHPGDTNGYYYRGLIFEQQNRLTEAKEEFQKILQINPRHAQARRQLRQIRMFESQITQQEPRKEPSSGLKPSEPDTGTEPK